MIINDVRNKTMTDRYILTKPLMIAHRFQTIQSVNGQANYNIRREMRVPTISRNAAGKNEVVIRMLGFVPAGAGKQEPTYFTVARSETVRRVSQQPLPCFRRWELRLG
jgi:putative SOS response-associated peptidase YedK